MNRRVKTGIIITAVVLLFLHFGMLFKYIFDPGNLSFYYVYPYFQQSWSLFVPPPHNNYNLFAEYNANGTHRLDVFKEILTNHQTNRFGGSEALLIALSNSIHYFEKEPAPDVRGTNFKIIEKFTINYLRQTRDIKLSQVKIILTIDLDKPSELRVYHN